MRIFYDTEFLERGPKHPIDLISIGMVREDGAEYYAISSEFDATAVRAHPWLRENVWPYLPQLNNGALDVRHIDVKPRHVIAAEVASFVREKPRPELWAYYGAYDHVALCQLFGRMADLPDGFPMWTNDLMQEITRLGIARDELPEQGQNLHKAIDDARWNRDAARVVRELAL
ncbi:3'-5' exoribonuclease [Frankia sp. Mgl5]|uniref:3'-5' exoribonuclease domain-containing protein n=1 Tax=Frankia sp. Mgl5 TaxID=2933793 RepID=UPI00200DDA25|nr:3'-5' exoribonuclease [Frankia sp. Mgl5]MCK9930006.1 3'-5' exoribonuclease [Frankia sp. Mgl5]